MFPLLKYKIKKVARGQLDVIIVQQTIYRFCKWLILGIFGAN